MKVLQVELTCHLASPAQSPLSLPCGASTILVRQPDLVIIIIVIIIIIIIMIRCNVTECTTSRGWLEVGLRARRSARQVGVTSQGNKKTTYKVTFEC